MGSRKPRNSKRARRRTSPRRKPAPVESVAIQDRLDVIAATASVVSDAMSENEESSAALVTLENVVLPLRKIIEELRGGAA